MPPGYSSQAPGHRRAPGHSERDRSSRPYSYGFHEHGRAVYDRGSWQFPQQAFRMSKPIVLAELRHQAFTRILCVPYCHSANTPIYVGRR